MNRIFNIMEQGDEVMCVTMDYVCIRRSNGEVSLYSMIRTIEGVFLEEEPELTVGYKEVPIEEMVTEKGIRVFTF